MNNLSPASKNIIKFLIMLSTAACIGGLIFYQTIDSYSIGYLLGIFIGTVLSIVRIVLLEKALNKSVDMKASQATNYTRLQYLFRYLITIAVMVFVGVMHPTINLIGALIGLVNMQFAAYLHSFLGSSKNSQQEK